MSPIPRIVVAASTDRVQAEALVTAGVELAAYQLTPSMTERAPDQRHVHRPRGRGQVTVTFRSEAARIDLNAAPKEPVGRPHDRLGRLAVRCGRLCRPHPGLARDRRNVDDDPENSLYRTSGFTYSPRHAPFPAVQELWLVKGVPPVMIERMLPFVTVFSNAPVNVLDAAPQVMAALPGMTPENLQELLVAAGRSGRWIRKSLLTHRGWRRAPRWPAPKPFG